MKPLNNKKNNPPILGDSNISNRRKSKTLLNIPEREDLPPKPKMGKPCTLIDLVEFEPDAYSRLIGMIRHGVAGNVAAEATGVNENTFYDWAKKGRADYFSEPRRVPVRSDGISPQEGGTDEYDEGEIEYIEIAVDTYYSRFFMDIRRAIAQCRAECEAQIAVQSPRQWLTHGPGKIFGNNWVENKTHPQAQQTISEDDSQDNVLDTKKALPSPGGEDPEETNEGSGMTFIKLSKEDSMDALSILEDAGILETNRQYKKQVKKQTKDSEDE